MRQPFLHCGLLSGMVIPCILASGMAFAEADVPSLVIPQEDAIQTASEDAGEKASDPSSYMLDLIRGQLTDRYAVMPDDETDSGRLESLLSGEYITDYASGGNPVQFSNTVFDVANNQKKEDPSTAPVEAVSAPAETPSASTTPADVLLTPAAIRAMSNMSPDQIEAIALLVELMENPDKPLANPQMALSAIPSLSDEDLANADPAALLAALSAPAPAPVEPPPPVNVGDGRDMALANWETILSPDGRVELSNPMIQGSRFDVEVGVVVGQFGRVTHISAEPGDLYVEFETGDRIEGKSVALDQGVPSLDEEGQPVDLSAGEILVSEAAPQSAADADRAGIADASAPITSIRPKARPDSLNRDGAPLDSGTTKNVQEDVSVAAADVPADIPRPRARPDHLAQVAQVPEPAEAVTAEPVEASVDIPRPRARPEHLVKVMPDLPEDPVIPMEPELSTELASLPAITIAQPEPQIQAEAIPEAPISSLAPQSSAYPQPHPGRQL